MPKPISLGPEADEDDLLDETGRFMRFASGMLRSLLAPARALRHGLSQTTAYKRVDGDDAAHAEPAWDLVGTLDVMLEEDLERMSAYLGQGARQATAAARARRRRRDHDRTAPPPCRPPGRTKSHRHATTDE